ncbi:hypothetical protein [Xenorhabdus bovienii]|uniref:hypothetical protein n=1 Tax=Xenorhabdus bovienii TaxID=40576 RepID=UPI0023B22146|nr:hypothetical protein [Xenorhabdus bovienii]MDE9537256.1 hypothetical protein [Xenorhabdus bovienii]MDE9590043.1 hypothetical protein [Xenorhabdus bovienii]
MSRNDIIFDINYSFYLENLFGTLMGRIDKFISITLIVLGGSVFSPFGNLFIFGALVAVISAAQFIYQPGRGAGISDEQAKKYRQLITLEPTLTDEELTRRFYEVQSLDSKPWGVLRSPAYKRASIRLELVDNTAALTKLESIWAWIAGDLPPKDA